MFHASLSLCRNFTHKVRVCNDRLNVFQKTQIGKYNRSVFMCVCHRLLIYYCWSLFKTYFVACFSQKVCLPQFSKTLTFNNKEKSKCLQTMLFFLVFQNDHYAYLLAEIFCLCCERWGGNDFAHLLGYSNEDGISILEVLLGKELHDQLHVLLALRISQAVMRPLQSLQQLRQFWARGGDNEGRVQRQKQRKRRDISQFSNSQNANMSVSLSGASYNMQKSFYITLGGV